MRPIRAHSCILAAFLLWGSVAATSVIVQPGDTWYAIAQHHSLTVEELQSLNPGIGSMLHPDQRIRLPEGATYEVQPGDDLTRIARIHDIPLQALQAMNGLSGNSVQAGATLRLPDSVPPPTHTVQEGDTLYTIAAQYGVDVDDLLIRNRLHGSMIHPGDLLAITGSLTPSEPNAGHGISESRALNSPSTASTPSDADESDEQEPLVVKVRPGDTLWDLAQQYRVEMSDLVRVNQLDPAGSLQLGQSLTIPGRYADTSTGIGGALSRTVQVQEGETLGEIAQRYDTTVAALMGTNHLHDTHVRSGQYLLIVPSSELTPARARRAPPSLRLSWPLHGRITSRFGYRMLVTGSDLHNGLDIEGSIGDEVRAAAAGTVTVAGWEGGLGNAVYVQASDGVEYRYGHFSRVAVTVGQHVQVGDLVGYVGDTGFSFGPHLHFEIRMRGEPLDPLPLLEH